MRRRSFFAIFLAPFLPKPKYKFYSPGMLLGHIAPEAKIVARGILTATFKGEKRDIRGVINRGPVLYSGTGIPVETPGSMWRHGFYSYEFVDIIIPEV